MLYDIINPSDSMTFHAPDLQVAALSMFLLSEGKFGADCLEDGGESVPIFLMGGAQAWWDEKFNESIDQAIVRRAGEVADALDSLAYGDHSQRSDFDNQLSAFESTEDRLEFISEWSEKRRTSMNDIGTAATSIAEQLREKYAA